MVLAYAKAAEPIAKILKCNLRNIDIEQPYPKMEEREPIQGIFYAGLLDYSKVRLEDGFEHEISRKKFDYSAEEEKLLFEDIYLKEKEEDEDPKYQERKMAVGRLIYNWLRQNNKNKTPYKIKGNPERVEIEEGEGKSLGGAFKKVDNTTP